MYLTLIGALPNFDPKAELTHLQRGHVSDLERQERLQIMLSVEELAALEDWRFEQRMPSRAAAVRELLRRGLAAEGKLVARPGSKSGDFGVLEPGPEPEDQDPA